MFNSTDSSPRVPGVNAEITYKGQCIQEGKRDIRIKQCLGKDMLYLLSFIFQSSY